MNGPDFGMLRYLLAMPRGRMLSLEGVGALLLAWSIADDDGVIRDVGSTSAIEALSFIISQHAAQTGRLDGSAVDASAFVDELVSFGLAVRDRADIHLCGWAAKKPHAPSCADTDGPVATSAPYSPPVADWTAGVPDYSWENSQTVARTTARRAKLKSLKGGVK